ncbi:hypothetical protein CPB86DRAFT_730120 [Serendipita vermifera]|nr:hypothetical protein CPB86DRAFT_730120 [Serendipita vermifera]
MESHALPIDGSIPVAALLFPDEYLVAEQDGVGLYDGNVKAANHQSGSIHVTSHRLIYIDGIHPRKRSLEFQLQSIAQTEYYVGFLTSSSKITITFKPPAATQESGEIDSASRSPAGTGTPLRERETTIKWECEICGNKNVSVGLTPSMVCQLCGVPRTVSTPTGPQNAEPRSIPIGRRSSFSKSGDVLSKSLPSTSLPSPRRAPSPSGPYERRGRDADTPEVVNSGDESDGQIACPVCTFLNFPSLRNCEMCGTPLPKLVSSTPTGSLRPSAGGSRTMKSAPASRPSSPSRQKVPEEFRNTIKVSFRKGGDRALYTALKNALDVKVWAVVEPVLPSKNRTGIHGLVEIRQATAQSTSENIQGALQDLEALMKQASEMVALAESFNRSLLQHQAQRDQLPEDAQFIITSSMARLGLGGSMGDTTGPVPATNQKGKSEEEWLEELAQELGRVLVGDNEVTNRGARNAGNPRAFGGLMSDRGMIALDEVWGAWNRVRGVSLIPPSTFMQVLALLPLYTNPSIHLRSFHNSLKVLHTPWYSQKSFTSRLITYLEATGPKTTLDVARQEVLSVGLVLEMIGSAEKDGDIVRDDNADDDGRGGGGLGGREVKWWPNYFKNYIWDGTE